MFTSYFLQNAIIFRIETYSSFLANTETASFGMSGLMMQHLNTGWPKIVWMTRLRYVILARRLSISNVGKYVVESHARLDQHKKYVPQ